MTTAQPAITVLMPSLNVARYIRACMESVVNQSFRDLEILCIDAGSTDGTLEILREYEQADERVRVILSDKKSYGYQMNLGLRAARGAYIGIVETDDIADRTMYEHLFEVAQRLDAQVVKANYYNYLTTPVRKSTFVERYAGMPYGEVLSAQDRARAMVGGPSIWTGIYQREMLLAHGVDFLETPGASFQDTAFILKVWMAAERAVLVRDAYIHYRNDNENSSVHSDAKVYCVCDEMLDAHAFMDQRTEWHDAFCRALWARRANAYIWNYWRLPSESRRPFLQRMHDEFVVAQKAAELDEAAFGNATLWRRTMRIVSDHEEFYRAHPGKAAGDMGAEPARPAAQGQTERFEATAPVVSVVIATHNAASHIERSIEDALWRDASSTEVMVVDDGSTDDTIKVVERSFAGDPRVWVIKQKHVGGDEARTVGLRLARGTHCQLVDERRLDDENARLGADLKAAQEELAKVREELDALRGDFEAVTNSQSFKLGRAVTASPRWLRDHLKRG